MCAEMMDVTRDEAKRILRRLELEAYSSIISAFRAQGDLSRSKKKILQELGTQLSISTERHRAEVRRAYSDDRLAVVAESVYGPGSCAEWAAEGRRLVPLMPRLVPQTVFSASATAAANTASAANAKALASSGNKTASGFSISNSSVSASSGSSNDPLPGHQQSSNLASSLKSQSQTGGTHANDVDGFDDDDGKNKKRRRLSVSSLNKQVTKVAVPTTLVTKPISKTTSVSTMTKAGKSLGPLGTVKTAPRMSSLSASASQVKLLTKTVAVTQTVCQAKTVLSYKTITSATSSPVKVQTVMTQSTPKTHTKITPATPSKIMLTPKTSSTVKSTSMPSAGSSVVTTSPVPVTLKTTTLTAAQLAGRQRVKQVTTRFKPLPGTVKFKTVTPATMGTCSTVTMVTPSPSSQVSSALPVSGSQPVVRVIHVPGTGGVGVSKPVVVMTTGLSKSTVGGVLPGVTSGTCLTKATSQVTQSLSVGKPPVSTATSLPSFTTSMQTPKTSNTVAQPVSSAPKTVVMTTLVGTKRVVLSVPTAPTTSLQGTGIAKSHGAGGPALTFTTASQSQALLKKDVNIASPISPVCLAPSPTQLTPSHSACTVTTQVRSRPLPALLPAPPKPPIVTTTPTSNATGSSRKLPTLLPAPAKVKAVIPTVLVPVRASVGSATTAQIQSSIPLVMTPTMSGADVAEEYPDCEEQQCSTSAVPTSQDCGNISTGPVSIHNEQNVMTEAQHVVEDSDFVVHNAESTNQDICKSAFHCEQSNATEADNNTSSEDDSLLICSETIDSGCNLVDNSTTLQYYQGVGDDTSIKNSVMQIEQVLEETQPSLSATDVRLVDTACDSDLHTLELQKEVDFEQGHSFSVVKPVENVTVERLDGSGVICDVLDNSLSHHLSTESLDANEHEKVYEAELDSAIHSVKGNVILEDSEEQLAAKDESLSHPMENALKVIASFVESMEGGSLGREEINHTTDIPAQDTHSDLQTTDSLSFQNSESCDERLDVNCEKSTEPHINQDITLHGIDSTQEQESDCNLLLRYHEENWDATSDANIDILSTSTSSCGSTPECSDLTEREIKALETAASVRTSGRKRKPPWSLEVSPSRQVSGWVRGALSLLQKVASYRGQGRRRGDVGAATWFLKPVDPVDAPGYYKVIKTPMDFGTIRIKLETGIYQEHSEFHSDMLLVKSNCLKYNPPGHDVTQDCDEVFKFYENEYTKMLERWEKCHVSPAKKPRIFTKAESTT